VRREGVGNDVRPAWGNASRAECVGHGTRDGDDGVESPEGEAVERFVEPVFRTATSKTMYGGYYRQAGGVPNVPTHQIRPVTMCVHDVYASRAAEGADEGRLPQICAAGHMEGHDLEIRSLQ
jgi:hypothetical protein